MKTDSPINPAAERGQIAGLPKAAVLCLDLPYDIRI
jgi:hypothetical protein